MQTEIGLSTACFYPELLTEETIEVISNLGFGTIEVFLETASEYRREYCERLRKSIENRKIDVYSVHAFAVQHEPFLFDKYRPRREDAHSLFRQVLEGAAILGARCITFHGPGRKWLSGGMDIMSDIAKRMDDLAYEASEYGVVLAWENVYWCLSHNPDMIDMALDNMKSGNIGFTLDIKQANRSRVSIERYLKTMGPRLLNVHVNDHTELDMCLLPGRGSVDYTALIKALEGIDYNGPMIIEVYRDNFKDFAELAQARDFLKSL
jgi:sugar phosphate isomerase/epimerase